MTAAGPPGRSPVSRESVEGLFAVAGRLVGLEPLGRGHIHLTLLATYRQPSGRHQRLVLQRLNTDVFPDPDVLAANVARVAAHLDGREAPRAVVALDGGGPVAVGADGSRWRAWRFLPGRTLRRLEHADQARAAGGAIARLTLRLADLPGPELVEPIAGFHDFARRRAAFEAAVAADAAGRAATCGPEIDGVRAGAWLADELERVRAAGGLPLRLVHNDAKAENILFADSPVPQVRAVLDLDTVAPGTVLFDVGDLIRSGAATGPEDSDPGNPDAVEALDVDLDVAAAVVAGVVEAAPGLLSPGERSMLALGGPLMAFEAAMRFLTDHLEGDVYFAIDRPGHNLVRSRNQLRLVERLVAVRPRLAVLAGLD